MTEWLFSYGTLQLESVQLSTFGRRLAGEPDALVGYESSMFEIDDLAVVATSGQKHHPIVRHTGVTTDQVPGIVFRVSWEEVLHADRYEVAAYVRVATTLLSGRNAWVYVDRRFAPAER